MNQGVRRFRLCCYLQPRARGSTGAEGVSDVHRDPSAPRAGIDLCGHTSPVLRCASAPHARGSTVSPFEPGLLNQPVPRAPSVAVAAACFRTKVAGQPTVAGERTARACRVPSDGRRVVAVPLTGWGFAPRHRDRGTRRIMGHMGSGQWAGGQCGQVSVRCSRYPGVPAVGQASSNGEPIRSGRPPCTGTSTGAGPRQRQRPVGPLPSVPASPNGYVGSASGRPPEPFPTLWGTSWDDLFRYPRKFMKIQSFAAGVVLTLPE